MKIEKGESFVATEANVTILKKMASQDQRITVKQLVVVTEISVGSTELILHDHLNMIRGFCALGTSCFD